ncbi:MAG: glycosyltransferase family 4 protein [Pelagimonas sp.]|nr:glycosyltransferase family 4 protein [Pelagimonas sp.]
MNRNLYSGGNARLFDSLCQHAGDVTILPNDWDLAEPFRRAIIAMPDAMSIRLRWRAHFVLQRLIARQVSRILAQGRFDVLFGAYSLQSLAGLKIPDHMVTVFSSDATQTVYRRSEVGQGHRRASLPSRLFEHYAMRQEARALKQADLLLWPSQWLRDEAQALYGLDAARAHVLPWGANIPFVPSPRPKSLLPGAPLRLLVIGRDWWAKGGPMAYETLCALREAGVDARLTVIGCVPPDMHVNNYVTVHPSLDKSVPAQLQSFERALEQAHFLFQPSYESYGFAFCEASAYGLPALCLRVGGVPVRDGVNGHALPLGATTVDFVALIRRYLARPMDYAQLSRDCRTEYETRLNWDSWGKSTAELLAQAVARKSHGGAK